jgi:hypothetical protein
LDLSDGPAVNGLWFPRSSYWKTLAVIARGTTTYNNKSDLMGKGGEKVRVQAGYWSVQREKERQTAEAKSLNERKDELLDAPGLPVPTVSRRPWLKGASVAFPFLPLDSASPATTVTSSPIHLSMRGNIIRRVQFWVGVCAMPILM